MKTINGKSILRIVGITAIAIFVALAALLGLVKISAGSGRPYPDVSTTPLYGQDDLELVAALPLPPGNVAVSPTGRVFFNYHYLGSDGDENSASVFELVDEEPRPFPDADFQTNFRSTLGMLIDGQNRLWILDPATIDGSRDSALFAFDVDGGELLREYRFEQDWDFAQDIQVTADGRYLISADTGLFGFIPAKLLVLDIESGEYRVLLKGHPSVGTENWGIRGPDGEKTSVFFGLIDWQAGVDGITISPDQKWLYYGSINHSQLYRLPLNLLTDPAVSEEDIEAAVKAVGVKPLSDGLSMDIEGNVYITDIENGGIARMSPDGTLETLVKDSRVRWADGISFGPDSWVYFTDSAISTYLSQTGDPPDPAAHGRYGPYGIYRFRNDLPGFPGR
jgi:hypothetical protein